MSHYLPIAGVDTGESEQPVRPLVSAQGGRLRPRRPTSLVCAWCGKVVAVKPRGRLPRWCSETCRHRAWELDRAAASGRAAVKTVDRVVDATHERTVTRVVDALPAGPAWVPALHALAAELDMGKLSDRDLPALGQALAAAVDAYQRRPATRNRNW